MWDIPFQEEEVIDYVLHNPKHSQCDLTMRYTPRHFGQLRRGFRHWQQQPHQYYLDQATGRCCQTNENTH